jgi:hypothetical protein
MKKVDDGHTTTRHVGEGSSHWDGGFEEGAAPG